ncbi:MAG: RnfABCDGE type electron transport complex subunit G [Flammeovirgaceae bacterium]|nr:RnfABCDGE type electron transport complex subunit G [Flammeovirgaceae bacterium]
MGKKESSFFNMFLTLLVVTLVASAALGFVYEFTKAPIKKARIEKKKRAIAAVLPDFDNQPLEELRKVPMPNSEDSLEFYPVKKGGELLGLAIKTSSQKGYSGEIQLMVGLRADGKINNISVLSHKETPGLGSKMGDDQFKNQFIDQNPETFNMKVTKDGGEVDAISGATISSRAFCEAVQIAFEAYQLEQKN